MEVLPPLDHAAISYAPFRKAFYQVDAYLLAHMCAGLSCFFVCTISVKLNADRSTK